MKHTTQKRKQNHSKKTVRGFALVTNRGALIEAAQQAMNVTPSIEQEAHGCRIVRAEITYPLTRKK